ncbi:hypothetical protein EVAR_73125_1, partial [Eumeta japonica]
MAEWKELLPSSHEVAEILQSHTGSSSNVVDNEIPQNNLRQIINQYMNLMYVSTSHDDKLTMNKINDSSGLHHMLTPKFFI